MTNSAITLTRSLWGLWRSRAVLLAHPGPGNDEAVPVSAQHPLPVILSGGTADAQRISAVVQCWAQFLDLSDLGIHSLTVPSGAEEAELFLVSGTAKWSTAALVDVYGLSVPIAERLLVRGAEMDDLRLGAGSPSGGALMVRYRRMGAEPMTLPAS